MLQKIFTDSTGRYSERTSTGTEHVITMQGNRRIARKRAVEAPASEFLHAETSELRRDGGELELLMLVTCRLGSPALFWIQMRDDRRIRTVRTTSPVVEILPLD